MACRLVRSANDPLTLPERSDSHVASRSAKEQPFSCFQELREMRIPVTILAVLLAFQASAQSENKVTVSGRAWGSIENVSATGATNGNSVGARFRVTNDSSFVRIRGDLKLSDDLTAWGVVEPQFALDGVGGPFDATRNTGVGFTSKTFGTLMVGRWDTPYKLAVIKLDPWGNTTILNYAAILGSFGTSGSLYDARFTNHIQYWTPVISGLQVKAALEVNEDKSAAAVPSATSINPWALSVSVTYDSPLYIGVAYETRKDCGAGAGTQNAPACTGAFLGTGAGSTPRGRDWGLRAGVGYNFKPTFTEVGLIFERLESQADFTTGNLSRTLKRDAFYASLVQGLGGSAHQIVLAGGIAQKTSGNFLATNDKTGASYWTASYRYNFNKDLMVHFGYVVIDNDDAAGYRFGASGLTGAAATAGTPGAGAKYQGWVLGTRYLF
jgi:predicted porin